MSVRTRRVERKTSSDVACYSRVHIFRILAVVTNSTSCVMFKWSLCQFPESRKTECNASFVRNLLRTQAMMLTYAEEEEGGIDEDCILFVCRDATRLVLCYSHISYPHPSFRSDACELSSTNRK